MRDVAHGVAAGTAYHEAGHAVAFYATRMRFEWVRAGDAAWPDPRWWRAGRRSAYRRAVIALAGACAARHVNATGPAAEVSENDQQVVEGALDGLSGSEPRKCRSMLENRAERIVRTWWPAIRALAHYATAVAVIESAIQPHLRRTPWPERTG